MGKIKTNIEALVSGKVGKVVYYQLRGKSYVRSVQVRKKDSWTPAQQLHRQRISKVGELWKQLKSVHIIPIWNLGSEEMNGYALFIKVNLSAFGPDGDQRDVWSDRHAYLSNATDIAMGSPTRWRAHCGAAIR